MPCGIARVAMTLPPLPGISTMVYSVAIFDWMECLLLDLLNVEFLFGPLRFVASEFPNCVVKLTLIELEEDSAWFQVGRDLWISVSKRGLTFKGRDCWNLLFGTFLVSSSHSLLGSIDPRRFSSFQEMRIKISVPHGPASGRILFKVVLKYNFNFLFKVLDQ